MDLAAALRQAVGDASVVVEPVEQHASLTDWTGRFVGWSPAVVDPASTAEVAAVVRVCIEHGAPWVPQGGNTGLVGGGVPVDGEVVVRTRRLNTIGPVDVVSRQVTVGAGVTLAELDAVLAPLGLLYGVDFGARDSATIGGTIATNAGGNAVIRFGMTRAQVVGIEAVLPNGETILRLHGLAKDNTGFDLAQLLCGSEGTLGIVTAARLRLHPRPTERATAALGVASLGEALSVLSALRAVDGLEQCEFMRSRDVADLCTRRSLVVPPPWRQSSPDQRSQPNQEERWCLLVEVIGLAAVDAFAGALSTLDGVVTLDSAVASSEATRRSWWSIREGHPDLARTFGSVLKLDVSVPLDRLATFVAGLDEIIASVHETLRLVLFGHLGDGNLHVNIGGDARHFAAVEAAVLGRVLTFGGVVSAEHGIGRLKRDWLVADRGIVAVDAMVAIKSALDPHSLANPNVLFPTDRKLT